MLILASLIPVLTILAGIVTLKEGLTFWGLALIALGFLALIGPFYVLSRRKEATDKPATKAGDSPSSG
jgi:threonine/homoserine efflux transporter RhtA